MNEELKFAVDHLRQMPADRRWFIPVLLSPCDLPAIQISEWDTLQDIQWVALYENWDQGIQKILQVIKARKIDAKEVDTEQIPHFEEQFHSFGEHFAGISDKLDRLLEYHNANHTNINASNPVGPGRVNPPWRCRDFKVDEDLCFLLMPFSEQWSDDVWALIREVVEKCELQCQRADEKGGRLVMEDVWEGICRARIVIADLTGGNPNVTYEVGLADCLGKSIVLLCQTTHVPFDFAGQRLILYENSFAGVRRLSQQLEKRVRILHGLGGSGQAVSSAINQTERDQRLR